jgi:hypothetical protein
MKTQCMNVTDGVKQWSECKWEMMRGGLWEKEWDAADVDIINFCTGLCSLVLHAEFYVVLNFFCSYIPSLKTRIENA